MNKFWEWMKEKDYGKCDSNCNEYLYCDGYLEAPPKQMLIGYMIEYINETITPKSRHKIELGMESGDEIIDIYDDLKDIIIEELGK